MNISILQWNIWYKEDLKNISKFIKSQNADVVCLQELTINSKDQSIKDGPAYIAEQLGYNYYCKELPIESTEGENLMLANGIFSRFPIVAKRFAWTNEPKNKGGYDDEFRAYVEVTLEVEGGNISIGTTHMSYTHRFEPTPNKKRETDLLVKNLKEHNARFIFTGDLNALPGSYTISSIEGLMQNAGPDFEKKSWATKPFSYNGFEETELKWRLDYVFTTKDLKVLSSKIVETDYSDHLPVLTNLSV